MNASSRPLVAAAILILLGAPALAQQSARTGGDPLAVQPRLAVAWTDLDAGVGLVRAMETRDPWRWVTPPLTVGRGAVLRFAFGRLYAVSSEDDSLTVVDPRSWTIEQQWQLAPGSRPLDMAVARPDRAYLTRDGATHLLRFNPQTGQSDDVVDLSVFGDAGASPDPGMLEIHDGRLFVQIRRQYVPPAYLAVVDLESEQLVRPPSGEPGIQLAGRAPHGKMQLVGQTRRLFLSASGGFFDDGGIEAVEVDALASLGLVIHESSDTVGANLGVFVLVTPERGFLTFSTDFALSSHLVRFRTSGKVNFPEVYSSLNYFAPTLVFEPLTHSVFYPHGGSPDRGVQVFDATSGERLNAASISTSGDPSDMVLLSGRYSAPGG